MTKGMTPITSRRNGDGAVGKRPEEPGQRLRFGNGKAKHGAKNVFRRKMTCFLGLALLCAAFFASSARAQLYAVDSSRALYTIDMNTGAKTLIGTVSANAGTTSGLSYDSVHNVVYLVSTSTDSLYSLDLATGTASLIGAFGDAAIVMHGVEYDDSTGILYGLSSHNNGLYNINPLTGAATLIGTSGLTSFSNLGYNSTTNQMFLTNSGTDSLYSIDRATGAVTLIGPLNGPTNPNGLAYNRDNLMLYMVDNNTDSLYTINTATGAANLIGSTGTGNLLGLVYIPIPEPASFILFGLGSAALAGLRLRSAASRRRKAR
jgi:hypothetical protein